MLINLYFNSYCYLFIWYFIVLFIVYFAQVGWWAGVSEDGKDPYGQIIHISAEHGRYVARSYSPR